MESERYSALYIASWIVKLSAEHGDLLTNLKLQKLLYYSQAWYSVLHSKRLFPEDCEAWVHGPVVPDVYRRYKRKYIQPITPEEPETPCSNKVKEHLLRVLMTYGGESAYQLELRTHQEYPWIKARAGAAPDETSHNVILVEDMQYFYGEQLRNAQKKK